jgi:hypothetical protein
MSAAPQPATREEADESYYPLFDTEPVFIETMRRRSGPAGRPLSQPRGRRRLRERAFATGWDDTEKSRTGRRSLSQSRVKATLSRGVPPP